MSRLLNMIERNELLGAPTTKRRARVRMLWRSGPILLVADLLHPIDRFSVKLLLDGDGDMHSVGIASCMVSYSAPGPRARLGAGDI